MNDTSAHALAAVLDYRSIELLAKAEATGQDEHRQTARTLMAIFDRITSLHPLADEQVQVAQNSLTWYRDNGLDGDPLLDHLDTTLEHWHLPEGTSIEDATVLSLETFAEHHGRTLDGLPSFWKIRERDRSVRPMERIQIPEAFHADYHNLRTTFLRKLGFSLRAENWSDAIWDIDKIIKNLEKMKQAVEQQLPPIDFETD